MISFETIQSQMEQLQPLMDCIKVEDTVLLQGKYQISRLFENEVFEDYFDVEITINMNFPKTVPVVRELSGKINPDNFNGHISSGGELCLEVNTYVLMQLDKKPTIVNFLEKIVTPCFVSFLYYERHGKFPFGQRSHGTLGILEFYIDLFKVDLNTTKKLMLQAVTKEIHGYENCICGSGRQYKNCHKPIVSMLKKREILQSFKKDCDSCLPELRRRIRYRGKINH